MTETPLPPPRLEDWTVDPRVQQVVGYISAHLAEKVSVAGLAREVGVSAPHLARIIRLEIGEPPRALIKRIKIEAAERALISMGRPAIKQVAWNVGYRSPSRFSNAFASICGATPGAWRRRYLAVARAAAAK